MNMKSRRLRGSVAGLAALAVLTACAKESDKKDSSAPPVVSSSPSPTGTPTTTPDQVQAFCDSLIALDTAVVSMGPPSDDEESSDATATPTAPSYGQESSASEAEATPMSMSTSAPMSSADPMASGSPDAGAPAGGPPSFPDTATAMRPVADMMASTKTREIGTSADAFIAFLRDAIATNDRKKLDDDQFAVLRQPLVEYGLQNCGYQSISTAAVEYEFDNLPKTASAGKTSVTLKNEGKEFHEIAMLRINDGVTDAVDDIMKLPDGELFSKVTPQFVTFAPPNTTGSGFTNLTAGRYIVLCFIPKGTKPGVEPAPDAPPHFTQGMLEELTVS